jgi:hypothetical protein
MRRIKGFISNLKEWKRKTQLKRQINRISKKVQDTERIAAIEALGKDKSPAAIKALLQRFTFYIEPSIKDQEEKELVFKILTSMGKIPLPQIKEFMNKAENLGWPIKILKEILSPKEVINELLTMLEKFDTEYQRNPEPKIQIISSLEQYKDPTITEKVLMFLKDVNETVRFHAIGTLFAQKSESAREPLIELLISEESVRNQIKIAEGFLTLGWSVRGYRKKVEGVLPQGFFLDRQAVIKKRRKLSNI